jgi:hypothetical protein
MLPGRTAGAAEAHGGLPGLPHFAPKAKRAIYLFMAGAPSQMDLLAALQQRLLSPDHHQPCAPCPPSIPLHHQLPCVSNL